MTPLWQSPELQRLGWALLHSLWQGALLFALAAVLLRAMRRSGPQARYLVACGALGAMLALAVGTYAYLASQATLSLVPAPAQPAMPAPIVPALAAAQMGAATAEVGAWYMPVVQWLPIGWMAGVLLFSARLLGGWYWLIFAVKAKAAPAPSEWQWRMDGLSRLLGPARRARLLVSSKIASPLVMGWIKPIVLIPASALLHLAPETLEAALAHELAHIRRHDYLVNFFQSIVEALFFYHPAAWWLSGQIRELREHCCDDMAAAQCGGSIPYATALADLESLRAEALPKLAPAAKGASLMKRIQRLLGVSIPVASSVRAGLLAAAILSMIGAGALWCSAQDNSQQMQRITIREGAAALNIQMRGDVKLDKNSKDGVELGEGAVLEISAKEGAATRRLTVRREEGEIKKTYQENGREKPLDADAEAWMNSQIKEIEVVAIHKAGLAADGSNKISFEIVKDGKDGSAPKIITYSYKDSAGMDMFNGEPFIFDGNTIEEFREHADGLRSRLRITEILASSQLTEDAARGMALAEAAQKRDEESRARTQAVIDAVQKRYEENPNMKESRRTRMLVEESMANTRTLIEAEKKLGEEGRAKAQAEAKAAIEKRTTEILASSQLTEEAARAKALAEAAQKRQEESLAKARANAEAAHRHYEENRANAKENRARIQVLVEESRARTLTQAEEARVESRASLEARLKRMEEDYAKAKKEGTLSPKELEVMEQDLKGMRNIHEYDAKVQTNYEDYRTKMKANPGSAQKWSEEYSAKARAAYEEFRTKALAVTEARKKQREENRAKVKADTEAARKQLEESLHKMKALEEALRKLGEENRAKASASPSVDETTAMNQAKSEAIKKVLEEANAMAKAEGRPIDQKGLEDRLRENGLLDSTVVVMLGSLNSGAVLNRLNGGSSVSLSFSGNAQMLERLPLSNEHTLERLFLGNAQTPVPGRIQLRLFDSSDSPEGQKQRLE
jgi:beta-lactamase regulating signal transducer with metallopeptidase domain